LNPYRKQYRWSNVFAMIRNLKLAPKICADDFSHRLVVITGATSGIGNATAEKFAAQGADLLLINRDEKKTEQLCAQLRQQCRTNCDYIIADFSKQSDVHDAAGQLAALPRDIDVLIHNAGVYLTQKTLTQDGLEMVFQVNYLSTFILNYVLLEKFKAQNRGRILFVNSEAYRFAVWGLDFDDLLWQKRRYSGLKSYGESKLAQLLSMLVLQQAYQGSAVTVNAMHPGNVRTNSGQSNGWLYKIFKRLLIDPSALPVSVAAEALYYLGASAEVQGLSGKFFNLTTLEEPAPPALDRDAAQTLWQISLQLGGFDAK